MDLSVIILNWNTRQLLKECLETLTVPQPGLTVQIIVVDNASEDGSREMVRALFPQVTLLVNPKNIGFGAGNNVALPTATGRYVLFLNSDTRVLENTLQTLVDYGDAYPDIGILGPKLLNADGSLQYSCRRYPNLATGFFRNTPLGRLFPQNRFTTDYLMQDWDHATPRDVDWVSGAALMMRRTLLDQIGSFDEDYYMYCEDVDLCWRANHASFDPAHAVAAGTEGTSAGSAAALPAPAGFAAASSASGAAGTVASSAAMPADSGAAVSAASSSRPSWRVTYVPDAVIYHYIGKSSDMVPTRMTYEFHRSQYLFYKKHYVPHTPLLLRPIILPGIVARALGQIARYRYRHIKRKVNALRQRRKYSEATVNTISQATSQTGGSRPGDAS